VQGKKLLEQVIAAVKEDIAQYGGSCTTVKEPQPIGKDFDVTNAGAPAAGPQ